MKKLNYQEKLKTIKPFIYRNSFQGLSEPQKKRKITILYDKISKLSSGKYAIYEPKFRTKKGKLDSRQNKAALDAVRKVTKTPNIKNLKVDFFRSPDPKAKIKVSKTGKVSIYSKYSEGIFHNFDRAKIARAALNEDIEGYVRAFLKPFGSKSMFAFQYTNNESSNILDKTDMINKLIEILIEYIEKTGELKTPNWLRGVIEHKFKNQASRNQYLNYKENPKNAELILKKEKQEKSKKRK